MEWSPTDVRSARCLNANVWKTVSMQRNTPIFLPTHIQPCCIFGTGQVAPTAVTLEKACLGGAVIILAPMPVAKLAVCSPSRHRIPPAADPSRPHLWTRTGTCTGHCPTTTTTGDHHGHPTVKAPSPVQPPHCNTVEGGVYPIPSPSILHFNPPASQGALTDAQFRRWIDRLNRRSRCMSPSPWEAGEQACPSTRTPPRSPSVRSPLPGSAAPTRLRHRATLRVTDES